LRDWLGLDGPVTCPVHGTHVAVVEEDTFLSYRCDHPGCRPADVARRLGQYMIAGVLDRLPGVRFGDWGIEADCPVCANPLRVGVREYEPDGYPLLLDGKDQGLRSSRWVTLLDPAFDQEASRLLDEMKESLEESIAASEAFVVATCRASRVKAERGADSMEARQAAEDCRRAGARDEQAKDRYALAQETYAEVRGRQCVLVPADTAEQAALTARGRYLAIEDDAEAELFLAGMEQAVIEEAVRLLDSREKEVCGCCQDDILTKIGLTPSQARWSGWPEYWDGYNGTPGGFPGFPGNSLNGQSGNTSDSSPWSGSPYAEGRNIEDFKDGSAGVGVPSVWESPRPLDGDVKVEPFPAEALPPALQAYAEEAARVIGCPLDYVGGSILAVAGAALGTARRLAVKGEGYKELANLWVCLVGPPGSSKTPAMNEVVGPLKAIAHEEFEAWESAGGAVLRLPWVSDVTTEAMGRVLKDNPKGVLLHRDELTGWVRAMDQYKGGKGSDRQFYLSAWSREPIHHLRKGEYDAGPVYVAAPFLGVLGGLPTEQLQQLVTRESEGDGFLDRVLFVHPDEAPPAKWSKEDVPAAARAAWHQAIRGLWALQEPGSVRFSPAAEERWAELYDRHAEEMGSPDLPSQLKNVWSKLRAYAARLTLLLHALHEGTESVEAGPASVEGAWRLVAYFKSHARRVYGCLDADRDMKGAKRIMDWLRRKKLTSFRQGELYPNVKSKAIFPKAEDVVRPLQLLEQFGHVRQVTKRSHGGRPTSYFEVNPRSLS
jgi:hypothetical protein